MAPGNRRLSPRSMAIPAQESRKSKALAHYWRPLVMFIASGPWRAASDSLIRKVAIAIASERGPRRVGKRSPTNRAALREPVHSRCLAPSRSPRRSRSPRLLLWLATLMGSAALSAADLSEGLLGWMLGTPAAVQWSDREKGSNHSRITRRSRRTHQRLRHAVHRSGAQRNLRYFPFRTQNYRRLNRHRS